MNSLCDMFMSQLVYYERLFTLVGIFNEILWAKTNKFMGEGEFDNLMGEKILKKILPVGESLPKISSWTSKFFSLCELTTRL